MASFRAYLADVLRSVLLVFFFSFSSFRKAHNLVQPTSFLARIEVFLSFLTADSVARIYCGFLKSFSMFSEAWL